MLHVLLHNIRRVLECRQLMQTDMRVTRLVVNAFVQLYARLETIEGGEARQEAPEFLCPVLALCVNYGADESACKVLVACVDSQCIQVITKNVIINIIISLIAGDLRVQSRSVGDSGLHGDIRATVDRASRRVAVFGTERDSRHRIAVRHRRHGTILSILSSIDCAFVSR